MRVIVMTASPRRCLADPPGGTLPWLIVGFELLTFTIVFGVVAALRRSESSAFASGRACLSQPLGLALTLVLLASGACAACGVRDFRAGCVRMASRWLLAAAALGLTFVVIEGCDHVRHAAGGHGLGSDVFWDAYVLATGFHLLHVLVGVVVLAGAARRMRRGPIHDPETTVAGPALFWHMCDVVWFFLWPLFFVGAP